ncbi:MAG: hypothetical protein HOO67_00820 [Candidatus Peribacteraceae bacterium]|nr:hypothetical protein [Candidatus Peribacteraceae bacterium]
MKTFLTTLSLIPLLASCSTAPSGPLSMPLQERMNNPLVAERYWSEMAEHMADYVRMGDAIAKDPVKLAIIDAERLHALDRVAEARILKEEGTSGVFVQVTPHETAIGEVLLRGTTLSFGTSFLVDPTPSARVYLTTMVDPRDGQFPDQTGIDLGELQTAYGAQEYALPDGTRTDALRTAVLYDTKLERVLGFAQLAK